jgi:subtilase family serine protease
MYNGFRSIAARGAPSSPNRRYFRAIFELLESRCLLSAAPVATPLSHIQPFVSGGYTPAEVAIAYGFNHIMLPSGTEAGAGQTIAIVDAYNDPNIAADLATFDTNYGLAAPPSFTVVSQTGSTTSLPSGNSSWGLEISLDVEWAHAMAPGANIMLVEANSAALGNLVTGVTYSRGVTGVSVVSMSWGSSDFGGESSFDSYFTTPNGHIPVTFIAASGDAGSSAGPNWPADSANVLGVGGTTLNTSSTGAYLGETGWSGSTGGVSSNETEPTYQDSAQSTGYRTEPDVSYDADPNTGYEVYDSYGYGGWTQVGGTSAGAPQWASLIAIADQLRVAAGKTTLDGPGVTLPTLYNAFSNRTIYAADFHDITSGSSSGSISAKVGYDEVSGIGSPKASAVVQSLVSGVAPASAATIAVRPAAAVSTKVFSSHHPIVGFGANASAADTSTQTISLLPSAAPLGFSSAVPLITYSTTLLASSDG